MELPSTGSDGSLVAIAAVLVIAGLFSWWVGRQHRPAMMIVVAIGMAAVFVVSSGGPADAKADDCPPGYVYRPSPTTVASTTVPDTTVASTTTTPTTTPTTTTTAPTTTTTAPTTTTTAPTTTTTTTTLPPLGFEVEARVLLQGALVDVIDAGMYSDQMRDDLRSGGLLPLAQPYGAAPFGYGGSETITDPTTVLADNGTDSIVDWVLIHLREPSDPTVIVETRAGLVQRDGDVVDTDGVSPLAFDAPSGADYFVSVEHRNHLEVMTATTRSALSGTVVADFTADDLFTRSDRAEPPAFTLGGAQLLWAGDVQRDGVVRFEDGGTTPEADGEMIDEFILNHPDNPFGALAFPIGDIYSSLDVNMNGEVRAASVRNDPSLINVNVTGSSVGNTTGVPTYAGLEEHTPG